MRILQPGLFARSSLFLARGCRDSPHNSFPLEMSTSVRSEIYFLFFHSSTSPSVYFVFRKFDIFFVLALFLSVQFVSFFYCYFHEAQCHSVLAPQTCHSKLPVSHPFLFQYISSLIALGVSYVFSVVLRLHTSCVLIFWLHSRPFFITFVNFKMSCISYLKMFCCLFCF